MKTIIEYAIIEGNLSDLSTEVNLRIKDGWKPQGGIYCYITPVAKSLLAYQAMVKEKESTE